jgi:hypothetical protein
VITRSLPATASERTSPFKPGSHAAETAPSESEMRASDWRGTPPTEVKIPPM